MSLQSIAEFSPEYYQESSLSSDLVSRPVFIAQTDEEIGTVDDILVDESGRFRYLVLNADSWLSDRKFLLPIGKCRAAQNNNSIALTGINGKQDLEQLPPYESDRQIDYDYEEDVRGIYRQLLANDDSTIANYDRDSYSYDNEPELYQVPPEENQTFKLYEEKLVTHKERHEVGEVTIGKRVETETAEVEVPIEKEKVVVKIHEVAEGDVPVEPGEATFEEGAVAKFKVYEETADIEKKAFVREEVEAKKVVDKEVVNASETLRKEELEMTGEENIEIEQ
ncbi:DUF2382 domain-containing protein [Pleurocapsa sp. FMAR1]|uniref:DUF2382 domain-containing protein n=1 Tax=Pleurocapsa sp. FMAR1 TaxID=3040204 RepID=UPI0029C7C5FC|nr:DUF2382 domain-containing protein [Pleurocapsa sp. FMAR1]